MATQLSTQLAGKVALITGSASGIGKDIAETYAQAGAAVGIADLNFAGAQATADAINAAGGSNWKKMLDIHLNGAFLTTQAALKYMYAQTEPSTVIYMGSIHSHLASPLKAPYVTAKHALLGLARTLAKEGAANGVRSYVICPGFVKTPLVEKQIPEQAREKGISEEEVVKNVMLGNTVDGEFTTTDDIAQLALFLAAFPTAALTGQSFIASHGWEMK